MRPKSRRTRIERASERAKAATLRLLRRRRRRRRREPEVNCAREVTITRPSGGSGAQIAPIARLSGARAFAAPRNKPAPKTNNRLERWIARARRRTDADPILGRRRVVCRLRVQFCPHPNPQRTEQSRRLGIGIAFGGGGGGGCGRRTRPRAWLQPRPRGSRR